MVPSKQIPFLLHSLSSQIFSHMKLEELLCKDGIDHRRMWQIFKRERDSKWKELQKQDGREKKQEDYLSQKEKHQYSILTHIYGI